jgi:hypothetical protein
VLYPVKLQWQPVSGTTGGTRTRITLLALEVSDLDATDSESLIGTAENNH